MPDRWNALQWQGGSGAQVVAPADGEGEAVARHAVGVGPQHHVGGGVVAVLVHRVRAVRGQRGGEADVHDVDGGDERHAGLLAGRWVLDPRPAHAGSRDRPTLGSAGEATAPALPREPSEPTGEP